MPYENYTERSRIGSLVEYNFKQESLLKLSMRCETVFADMRGKPDCGRLGNEKAYPKRKYRGIQM
jgi:hypothetical protein